MIDTHGAGGKVAIAENAICLCQSARKLFSQIHPSLETRAFNTTEMPEEMHAELINLALEMRGWNPREL